MVDSTEMRGTATGTGTGTATATEDSHFVVANKNKTKAKPSTFLRRKSQNSETQNWQMREIKRTLEYHKVDLQNTRAPFTANTKVSSSS